MVTEVPPPLVVSLQRQIVNKIAAKLTVSGIETRVFPDGGEITESATILSVVVCDSDEVIARQHNGVERRMSGHVILEDTALEGAERDESDTLRIKIENALLQLETEIGPPAILFEIDGYSRTFSGEDGGRIGARINWSATYRHKPTDISAVP